MTVAEFIASENLTLTEFGRLVGISPGSASRFARGLRTPSIRLMRQIRDRTDGRIEPNDWLEPVSKAA